MGLFGVIHCGEVYVDELVEPRNELTVVGRGDGHAQGGIVGSWLGVRVLGHGNNSATFWRNELKNS